MSDVTHIRRAPPYSHRTWCGLINASPSISERHAGDPNPTVIAHVQSLPEPLCQECLALLTGYLP